MLVLLCCLWAVGMAVAQEAPESAQLILHLLDYVAVDYPEFVQDGTVIDQAEYDEQLEFSQQARELLAQLPTHADQPELLRQAEQLVALVQGKRPGPEVSALAQQLRWHIIRTYHIEVAPQRPPDLRAAAALYQARCAACHGAQGQGDGPAGANLDPPPSNFHDQQRMQQRSIYGLYSTITLGVQGTGMASFRALSEDERWALAFYVSALAGDAAELRRGAELWQSGVGQTWFADLASVATATASEVRGTLSSHTLWALALVSFLAVYREAFETVLFYQALWLQAAPAHTPVLAGLLTAAITLAGLAWLILRGSVRLPASRLFFGVTSVLVVLLAVIFVGKGIAALQEAGTLPVDPVNFPGIPALGIYPDLLGLALQAVLLLSIAGVFVYTRSTVKET